MKLSLPEVLDIAKDFAKPYEHMQGTHVLTYLSTAKKWRPFLFGFDLIGHNVDQTFDKLLLHAPCRPRQSIVIIGNPIDYLACNEDGHSLMPEVMVNGEFDLLMRRILLAPWWPQYAKPRPYKQTSELLKGLR